MTDDPGDLDEGVKSTWVERGRTDGPIAFRAIVRATIEGAESRKDQPDQQAAAVLFAWTKDEVQDSLAPALAALAGIVHHDAWSTAFADGSTGAFAAAYRESFLTAYLAAASDFRAAVSTVADFLAQPASEERPWRDGLGSLWATMAGSSTAMATSAAIPPAPTDGSRYVVYQYCVSIGILSFKRSSGIKTIRPGQSRVRPGLPYTMISLVVGWWGIPWGPFWTLQTMARNFRGGIDVTGLLAPPAPQDDWNL